MLQYLLDRSNLITITNSFIEEEKRITVITDYCSESNFCRLTVREIPSVLWRCWLGGRKGIRPVKKLSSEVLAWLSVWSEVQTSIWPSWCHCHKLSLAPVKSRLVLPFWYRLTWVVPDKGPLNVCVWLLENNSNQSQSKYKTASTTLILGDQLQCVTISLLHSK